MAALFKRLESPAVTDLQIARPRMTVEAWPSPIPTCIMAGPSWWPRARPADGRDHADGPPGNGLYRALSLIRQRTARASPATWAPEDRLGNGTGAAPWGGRPSTKRSPSAALTHGLVTRLTSLVAVDVTPSRPVQEPWATTEVPLDLPQGWSFEKVFGKEIEDRWHGHPRSARRPSACRGGAQGDGRACNPPPRARAHRPVLAADGNRRRDPDLGRDDAAWSGSALARRPVAASLGVRWPSDVRF